MTIKHLVLCGGGPVGLVSYGAIKKLMENKIIIYEKLNPFILHQFGSIVALIFMLNLNFEWIDDFIIKRNIGKTYSILNLLITLIYFLKIMR